MSVKRIIPLLFLFLSLACGEKSGPTIAIQLAGQTDTAFSDPSAFDMVIIVQSIPFSDGTGLIIDGVQNPKFVFPEATCAGDPPTAGCGYPLSTPGTQELKGIPLNFLYTVEVRIRDLNGTDLYSGTSGQFTNSAEVGIIQVSLAAVTP